LSVYPRLKNSLILLFLCVVCFAIYANSLKNAFVYDDRYLVIGNSFIKNIHNLPQIFSVHTFYFAPIEAGNYYRPMAILTYALDYQIWKLAPFGYHFSNVLLHAICAFLFFLLVKSLFDNYKLALLSAILFAIHPLQTSGVNFIACRDNFLVTIFGILAILYYLKSDNRKLNKILAVLFYTLSLLSKENALLFIPLIATCALIKKEKIMLILKKITPFFFVTLIYLFFRAYIIKVPLESYAGVHLNPIVEVLTFFSIIFEYIKLLILPLNLYVVHTTPFINSLMTAQAAWTSLFIILFLLIVIRSVKNKQSTIWFGLFWFIISLAFIIKSMHVRPMLGAFMSEWWVYLPSMGLFVILSDIILKLSTKYKLAVSVLLFLIVTFWVSLTIYNNTIWADELSLYRNNLRFSPLNTGIRLNLANVYFESGDFVAAEKEYKKVLELNPRRWAAYLRLGDIELKRGNSNEAMFLYKESLRVRPDSTEAWDSIGRYYVFKGDKDSALKAFSTALKYNSRLDYVYADLGTCYFQGGDFDQAKTYFNQAAQLSPDNSAYFLMLGMSYANLNLFKQAKESLSKSLEVNPNSIDALYNLGNLYANNGYFEDALKVWRAALAKDPKNILIKDNITKVEGLKKTE
jgi:tetratricopeptide (TPR) repeat protein